MSVGEPRQNASALSYVAITTAMMGALMFGADQGNYGLVQGFPSFYKQWCTPFYPDWHCSPTDDTDAPAGWTIFLSWGGSLITVGAAIGSLFLGPRLTSSCGRRICISAGGMVCCVGCLFASFLSFDNVTVYYAGRFTTGFGAGLCCFALPLYNSEIATPQTRGVMGSLFQFMVVVGGLIAAVVLAMIVDWRIGMMLPGFAGVIVGLLIWLVPESPRYVMEKKGYDAGMQELQRVRKGDVSIEATAIWQTAEAEKEMPQVSYWELVTKRGLRKRVFIACYMQCAQQLTGVNAFLSYTVHLFEGAGIPESQINSLPGYAIYFNVAMLLGCILGLSLIDSKFGGRRLQLAIASVIMGPPLVIAALAMLFAWPGWIGVVMLFLYGIGFQFAWGLVPWIYPSEIFSMAEKDKAVSLATFFQFLMNFVVAFGTEPLMSWSPAGTYLIFGALNITNLLFVLALVKETKGLPLEDTIKLFEGEQRERQLMGPSSGVGLL